MDKKRLIVWGGLAVVLMGGLILYLLKPKLLQVVSNKSFEFVEKNISGRVITSEPLRKDEDDENAFLSVNGVIEETNRNRREAGLPELKKNASLGISAQKKVDDMFSRQYFEHDAPTGEGAGDLVNDTGYEFIVVGENLALGNYKNDMTLVKAWMDSPGHRENILKESYLEIGVAVAKGVFEGKETWLAVQHFAKPMSSCPQISVFLKGQIDKNNAELDVMKAELETRKKELEENKPTNREEGEEYNKKVDEYNNLVNSYNSLLATTKELIANYNSQVSSFNACAKS